MHVYINAACSMKYLHNNGYKVVLGCDLRKAATITDMYAALDLGEQRTVLKSQDGKIVNCAASIHS